MPKPIYELAHRGQLDALREALATFPTQAERLEAINTSDPDDLQWNPLNIAAASGNAQVVALLLDQGADGSIATDLSPLHHAVMSGNAETVALLANRLKGVPSLSMLSIVTDEGTTIINQKSRDEDGVTPLHLALQQMAPDGPESLLETQAYQTRLEIVRILIDAGANVNEVDGVGRTPIFVAAQNGDLTATKTLLAHPAIEPFAQDKNNRTPIHIAASGGFTPVIEAISTYILEQPQGSPTYVRTSLCFVREVNSPTPEVLNLLALESADEIGWRAIHFAARNGHTDVVRYLIHAGCDVNASTAEHWTALHFAVSEGHFVTAQYLIQNSCNAAADTQRTNLFLRNDSDATALHFAALRSYQGLLESMVHVASDCILNQSDRSPLHNQPKCLAAFLNCQDKVGYTALHLAAIKGDADAVAYLLSVVEPTAAAAPGTTSVSMSEPPRAVDMRVKDYRGRTAADIVAGILETDYGVKPSDANEDEASEVATDDTLQEMKTVPATVNESFAHDQAKEVQMAKLKAVLLLLQQD